MKPSALMSRPLSLLLALTICSFAADAPKPLYSETFDSATVGKLPQGFKVLAGGFAVQEDGKAKFIELPGAPLDSFGVVFGPSEKPPLNASAKIFGTKTGRKFPAFGLSVGGAGGYRLQVSAAKKMLEIFKGDEGPARCPLRLDERHVDLSPHPGSPIGHGLCRRRQGLGRRLRRTKRVARQARGPRNSEPGTGGHLGKSFFRNSDPVRRFDSRRRHFLN
jgi:hypothetical protein